MARPFAGDFVVTSRAGNRLDVAVVDVSGKGQGAGTRALLLSGAIGGLLSALPPSDFLAGANTFLLQQDWDEGFATAIHLSLDLDTGRYDLRSAGHPPAAAAPRGLGPVGGARDRGADPRADRRRDFAATSGEMRRGDALLLYTDGMVETRTRDIGSGIDKMLGQAERLLRGAVRGRGRAPDRVARLAQRRPRAAARAPPLSDRRPDGDRPRDLWHHDTRTGVVRPRTSSRRGARM